MEKEDYEKLEELLGKLSGVLKQRYCIIPEHIQDLAYVGIYDTRGYMIDSSHGTDVQDAVNKLLKKREANTSKTA